MLEVSTNEKYDLFVLLVTDIINSDSKILVVGAEKDKVGNAFNVKLDNNTAFYQVLYLVKTSCTTNYRSFKLISYFINI